MKHKVFRSGSKLSFGASHCYQHRSDHRCHPQLSCGENDLRTGGLVEFRIDMHRCRRQYSMDVFEQKLDLFNILLG
ncbi:hypothetical protein D3C86_1817650 [compost metagenome]